MQAHLLRRVRSAHSRPTASACCRGRVQQMQGRRALASKAGASAEQENRMDEPLIWPGADAASPDELGKRGKT